MPPLAAAPVVPFDPAAFEAFAVVVVVVVVVNCVQLANFAIVEYSMDSQRLWRGTREHDMMREGRAMRARLCFSLRSGQQFISIHY